MRRLWIVLVLLLGLAYWAWPYAGAYAIARAAAAHDTAALADRISEPDLKRSLGRQIIAAYLAKSGRGEKMGALQRGLVNAVGTTVASPYLDQLLSPDALATLLGQGRIGSITVGDRTVAIDRQVPNLSDVLHSHVTDVLLHSTYDGLTSFRFSVPEEGNASGQDFGIHVRLRGLTWRLSGIDLPSDVLDRIATDALAAERNGTKAGG